MGERFELRTDHSGLKYLFGKPTLNARQSQWLEFLSEYDFDIMHIKGKENKVVHALKMILHDMHSTIVIMYKFYFKDQILEAAKSYQQYMQIKEKLQQGDMQQKIEYYKLGEEGILKYKGIMYVPNSQELKNMVLKDVNIVPYVGHPGYQKNIAAVKHQYYWLGMKNKVANFISMCLECKKFKADHRHLSHFLQPFPIPEWKWKVVTMDFITKLPRTAKQHNYIMVVVDKITRA
jgi:hypothetical protein